VQDLREWLWQEGLLQSKLMRRQGRERRRCAPSSATTLTTTSRLAACPSHRALAVFRGRALDILDAKLVLPEPEVTPAVAPQSAQAATQKQPQPVVSLAEGRIALQAWAGAIRAALATI